MFYLLLTLALDFTRPELLPETDISGNYIVGSVSDNEVVVDSLSELPPVTYTTLSEDDSSAIVDAINESISHNDAYWEEFLTSYQSNFYTKYNSSHFNGAGSNHFYINSSGKIALMNSNTQNMMYVPVKLGRTYTIYGVPTLNGEQYFTTGFVDTLTPVVGSDAVGFVRHGSSYEPNGTSFTSPLNGYFCFYSNTNINPNSMNFYVLETQTYRDDVTVIKEEFNYKLSLLVNLISCGVYVLCFMAFVPFLTKTVDKLMNKKED